MEGKGGPGGLREGGKEKERRRRREERRKEGRRWNRTTWLGGATSSKGSHNWGIEWSSAVVNLPNLGMQFYSY